MKDKIEQNKWIFKQFTIINRVAKMVYDAVQGGIDMNFYECYCEYENGRYGFIKEAKSFNKAVEIYEYITANDGWDIVNQLEDEFGDDIRKIKPDEILEWENKLSDVE